MQEKIILELLERVIALESRVSKLERGEKGALKGNAYGRYLPLIRYLSTNLDDSRKHLSLHFDKIKEILSLENITQEEFDRNFSSGRLRNSRFFVHLQDDGNYEFAIKPSSIGLLEITDRLRSKLQNIEGDYLEIKANDFHKELGLSGRIPTVCKAMINEMGSGDMLISGNRNAPTSLLTIRYRKR